MQTIARANRVAPGKESGLIVDYVGVFRALQNALATYARPEGGNGEATAARSWTRRNWWRRCNAALDEAAGFAAGARRRAGDDRLGAGLRCASG